MKFKIFYGWGGGFGGANNEEVCDCDSLELAENLAFDMACEEYESYVGMYGLRDIVQIMKEDDVDEEEAQEIFEEERESWLDYRAEQLEDEEPDSPDAGI